MPDSTLRRYCRASLGVVAKRLMARYSADAGVRLRDDAGAVYLKHAPLERFRIIHFATNIR
jgi:hypothetical protein